MALVLRAGTNSSPSLVLRRTLTRILDLDHQPPPLTYLNPLHPRIPSPDREPTLPPAGRLAIAVVGGLQKVAMVAEVVSSAWLGIYSIPWPVDTQTQVQRLLVLALDPAPCLEVGSPALVPNPEIYRLNPGIKPFRPITGRIQTLDLHIPHRRPMIG